MAGVFDPDDCPSCSGDALPPHPIFDLCKFKRFDEALDICRREIAQNPGDTEGYRHMAIVLDSMGRRREALSYRDKVIELAPDRTENYYSRADLLYEIGDYAAAIDDFTRAAELDHGQFMGPGNYLYRADCHRRLGNYAQAIADCARVPDDFDFPGFLGHWEGTKHHLLAAIEREQRKS